MLNPSWVINNPTAAGTANFSPLGIILTIRSLTPKTVSRIKIEPDMNTIPNPCCQVTRPVATREKANRALDPIPGNNAKGILAYKAMNRVASPPINAVTTTIGPLGIPAPAIIAGCTTNTYAVVIKVTSPAMISVGIVVFLSPIL